MKEEKKYIIKALYDYILECPYLTKLNNIFVNFLDKDSLNYSIEEVPGKTIVSKHVDGSSERQITFTFASVFDFSEEIETQINDSGFYEDFSEWIEENDYKGVYPELKEGLTPTSIEVVTSGYLYSIISGHRKARYQIQCKLTYEKEGKIK